MTKRQTTSDSTLEKHRAEWRKSRKKRPLAKALAHCRDHRLSEHAWPAWLKKAIYEFFGLAEGAGLKKTGRPSDLVMDGEIYDTVEDYLRGGYTQEQAWDFTARKYHKELKAKSINTIKRPRITDFSTTVKKTWKRHKERIAFDHVPLSWGEGSYRIKDEYLKNDRNAKEWMMLRSNVPSYLKPETKNPIPRAEIEAAVRALRLALAKNKHPRS